MKNTKKIVRYLDGEMGDAELKLFEEEIKTDSDLAEQVFLHMEVDKTLKDRDIIELRKKIKNIYQSFIHSEKNEDDKDQELRSFRNIFNKKYLVAASIIVLMVISSLILFPLRFNNDKLFNRFYDPYLIDLNFRSVASDYNAYEAGIRHYKKGEFEEALGNLSKIDSSMELYIPATFFSAISSIETGRIQEAIEKFNIVVNANNDAFINHSEWYLGLCSLLVNDNEKAVLYFQKVKEKDVFYEKRSKKILRLIKR